MPSVPVIDETLIARLPLPLAQLYRRAHNAKTPRDAHDCALYLWEAALKLLASAAIVTLAAESEPGPEIATKLKNLARPSLGHWRELVRLLIPALADREAYERLAKLLDERRVDLPRTAALDLALRQALGGAGGMRQTVCVGELLDRIVEYRNKEQGHAAPAAKVEVHFRPLADALLAAAAELFPRLDVLAGRQLMAVTEIRPIRTTWLVERSELRGVAPWRIASLELPRTENAAPALREGLHLVDPARPDDPAAFLALRPLVDYDAEQETVLFINGRRGKNVEMLCYTTGDRFHLAPGESPGGFALDFDDDVDAEPPGVGEPGASATGVGRMIGDYELVSELGRGAMGIVYRARQLALGREVALKVQPRPNDPKADARFRREVRALARVDHPNVVRVFTSGVEGEQFYYTMELLDGAPLTAISDALTRGDASTTIDLPQWQSALSAACDEVKRGEKPLSSVSRDPKGSAAPPEPALPSADSGSRLTKTAPTRNYIHQIVALMRQAADAAHALHENGVLHRDIKPGNIQVTPDGSQAVLLDLGLAQLADDVEGRLTRTTQFVGTRRYASPEQQIDARTVDRRSDVYSLGATLWELIALRPLFNATDETPLPELIQRVQRDEPARLRSVCPAAGRDLEAVVHKCLEKRPEHRYVTVGDLAADLQRVLDGEPVMARAVGTLDRAAKWVRRHPTKAAANVLGFLTLALVLAGSAIGYSWHIAVGEREQARSAKEQAEGANRRLDAAMDLLDRISYVDRIQHAQAKWNSGECDVASQLLDQCVPEPNKRDYRGWEWWYFNRLWRPTLHLLTKHIGAVTRVVFSPDGALFASAGEDKTVQLWQATSGKHLRSLSGHTDSIGSLAFSPDGIWLASGSVDTTVRIWDVKSGKELNRLSGHSESVFELAFSPDSRRLASASDDETVRLWDPSTGQQLHNFKGHIGKVRHLAFSSDSTWLSSGAEDGSVRFWDTATGKTMRMFETEPCIGCSTSVSPDQSLIAMASGNKSVLVWEVASGKQIHSLEGHTANVWHVVFSPDGRRLASASDDKTVRLWEIATGKEVDTLKGHSHQVWHVAFSPDGRQLASSSTDKTVRLWDARTGKHLRTFAGHTGSVHQLAYSPDGTRLASASGDGTVRIWDAKLDNLPTITARHANRVTRAEYSRDGALLATAGEDNVVQLCETATSRSLFTLQGHENRVHHMAFSPDGTRFISASSDKLQLWNTNTGQPVRSRSPTKRDEYSIGARGPHLRPCLISVRWEYLERQFDMRYGGGLELYFGPIDAISEVGKVSDGTWAMYGDIVRPNFLSLRNPATDEVTASLSGHNDLVNYVEFSHDGTQLATASKDHTIRLWDASNGKSLGTLVGHRSSVLHATFSSDKSRMASASADKTIRLWDMTTHKEVATLVGHTGSVSHVVFSDDGARLASSSDDKTVCLWVAHESDSDREKRSRIWRECQVEEAEKNQIWFAARFHLDQLLKLEPDNADYRERREYADAEWKKAPAKTATAPMP